MLNLTDPKQPGIVSLTREKEWPQGYCILADAIPEAVVKKPWSLYLTSIWITTKTHIFFCQSKEIPICPLCKEPLVYRDRRKRILKWYNGEKRWCMLRRLRCRRCRRLHIELPDILTPHKHYATEVIENVVDDVSTPDDQSTELYPCERTMQRWKDWIHSNAVQIDGYLKSVFSRVADSGKELLNTGMSLLQLLRDQGCGWLATVNRSIYNTGGWLAAHLPPGADAPALSCCPMPP